MQIFRWKSKTARLNLIKLTQGILLQITQLAEYFKNNILHVNSIKTRPLGGIVTGNAAMNLITTELKMKLKRS